MDLGSHPPKTIVAIAATAFLLAACSLGSPSAPTAAPTQTRSEETEQGESQGRGGAEEVLEEQAETAERLEALAEARAGNTFGTVAATTDPAPGWAGSEVINPKTDDWEPAIAADPHAPYVYMLTTRYGQEKLCPSHCPTPYIVLVVSKDGGKTWGDDHPLCVCRGSGAQYDPVIEVVPNTGVVYAGFLNADRAGGFSTVFIKSANHGRSWTDPVHVYGKGGWTDKPEITTSLSGRDVYASWNGPTGGDPWIGQSHDFGETWTQLKLVDSKRYFFAYDARVLPDSTVLFSESSLTYTGPGASAEGKVWHHVLISRDDGKTWENVIVDKVPVGEPCVALGCGSDFYTGQTSISSNPVGHLVFAYEGPTQPYGPQLIYVRLSDNKGRTWGPRIVLSEQGENATQPRLAGFGSGEVRIWYMQTVNNDDPDAWNVWFRSSSDGGSTWSSPVKISDAPAGAARYVNSDGFDEIYGDYGEVAITNTGKTIAVWGEGRSWIGPGGSWFNRQL
jgi:hypothetical protein